MEEKIKESKNLATEENCDDETKIKRKKSYDFWINFIISLFFASILWSIIGIGGLLLWIGIYFLVRKMRSKLKYKEILYNILVAFVIFPFLAVNIGRFVNDINIKWSMLLFVVLAIVAYVLAKPARIAFGKILNYISNTFKRYLKSKN